MNQELIIHETDNDYILRSPLANFASYDYYYLQLTTDKPTWFHKNLNVVYEKPGDYMIVEVRNENQLLETAERAHDAGHFCGMIQKLSDDPIRITKQSARQMVGAKRDDISQAVSKVKIDNIIETMKTMVSWQTRFESHSEGQQTGEKLKALYDNLVPKDRDDVEVELVDLQGSPQKSIIVRIKGSATPDKIAILGSHIDSINRSDNGNAPGADDNASGTATNMEVFRVLMEQNYKPASTIEIHGYAAEEIGLVGSKELASLYRKSGKQVVSMVQFDMNAYAGNGEKITFVSNKTDKSLTNQLKQLVGMYNTIPASSGFMIFGSSDHASWNAQGFPVAFPTEDPFSFNRKIHTPDDTMANINSPKQIEEFAKLGVAYFMEFAK